MKELTPVQKEIAKRWLKETEFSAKRTCPEIYRSKHHFQVEWHCHICWDLFPSAKFVCPCKVLTYKHVRRVVLKAVK